MRAPFILKPCMLLIVLFAQASQLCAQSMYFPPAQGNDWETLSPDSLNWCPEKIDSLYSFLDASNAKAFIVLKDGRMVLEQYFDTFTADSMWYWASAGKCIMATLMGIAQEEELLDIHDPVSNYLGEGWTSCSPEEEVQRSIFHQLTMSSGFDTNSAFWNCVETECYQCVEDPEVQWHYQNGVYLRTFDVLEEASGITRNQYTNQRLKNPIGMGGFWFGTLYISTARDMARFGHLALNDFHWDGNPVLSDSIYANAMRETALEINPAYGYLWWLNGKDNFYAPLDFNLYDGWLIPTAPPDLYAAMGANEQRLYIVPSQGLVVARMGSAADESVAAISGWDTDLWELISNLECEPLSTRNEVETHSLLLYPNPAQGQVNLDEAHRYQTLRFYDLKGRLVKHFGESQLGTSMQVPAGFYLVEATLLSGEVARTKLLVL